MRSSYFTSARKWVGASALAIIIGLGGGTAFLAATGNVTAQGVMPAAQINPPTVGTAGFADLVEAVSPAVVSIVVESEVAGNSIRQFGGGGGNRGGREFNFNLPDLPEDHPFRDFFEQFGDRFGNNNAPGRQGEGQQRPRRVMAAGSGFIISADGYIVTNNHVVQDASKVTVVFDDGDERIAEVIGTDERTDLALIKINGENLPFVELATEPVRVGDWVVAVGNPFGLGGTVTAGIVSGQGRDLGGTGYGDFIQIDAAVNTGNSGGPAFNLNGEVVGVNTAIFSPNGGNVGIAFAIPAGTVEDIVADLRSTGTVTRGYLGVGIQDVTRDIADSVGRDAARGALVTEPTEGGPAIAAGVRSGDVIVAVNGTEIRDAQDLSRTIARLDPGTSVNLSVWRDGAENTVAVTLGTLDQQVAAATPQQAPVPPAPVPTESTVGLTLVPNGGGNGLLIQDVDPDSTAADKGIAVGDAILEVDNKPVASAEEFDAAIAAVLQSGRGTALIKMERNGNVRFLGLPIETNQG